MNIYTAILRPLFFRLDAEQAHHLALRQLSLFPPSLLRLIFRGIPRCDSQTAFGVDFPNPVGLAAGMDKNAIALSGWEALGFGFVEIGTITARAQPGNPRPRLFRYPRQSALVNRMGFNNEGAEAIAARLEGLRKTGKWPKIPVGINLGKSKVTPLDEAPADYLYSFRMLRKFGDYFVINVSSPNTPGLRDLQETRRLGEIIRLLHKETLGKPLLVKIAPDLSDEQAIELAALCESGGIAGLIATNTTLDHSALPKDRDEQGGLSGRPLGPRATDVVRLLKSNIPLPLIASGGVMDAATAKEKFDAGARLVQIYTGLVYRGPQLIREIASLTSKHSTLHPS
ncbi:MAG: quinone-dependent dihydroorotate dehydrogenase [Terrimicrobiaceae bacterium]